MKYTEAEIKFSGWADGGLAVGNLPDGRTIFARGVIPGETARVRFLTKESRMITADVLKICDPSEIRIKPRCPLAKMCGHCQLQFVPYSEQLKAKTEILADQLIRLGKIQNAKSLLTPIVSSSSEWEYRRSMVFYLDSEGKLGLLDRHGVHLPLKTYCPICCGAINENLISLEVEAESGLNSIEARAGDEDELQFIFHGEEDKPQNEIENDSEISLVYAGPESSFVMSGVSTIRQTVGKETLCISDSSDFSPNPDILLKIQECLSEILPKIPFDLLQLNAGCGYFSHFLAQKACSLTVLTAEEQETEDFIYNLDPFENVSLYIGPLSHSLAGMPRNTAEIVFAEAGTTGFSAEELSILCARHSEKIVYFGKDSAIFARDLARVRANGYLIKQIIPFDPAPQTAEIWALAELIPA